MTSNLACVNADKIPAALAPVDRMCLARYRPEHLARTVPESLHQKSAACLFQDVALFNTPWSFNVTRLPDSLRRATHIWQAGPPVLCLLWTQVPVPKPASSYHLA
jgi:hypothetical protein